MSVSLVHITPDPEFLITKIARVSNPNNQDNRETAPRLIRYLIKNKHWSPFEMANMCVEITTTRAIAAQILRHRSLHFQEYSQRYAVVPAAEPPNLRRQDEKNRQASHDDVPEDVKSAAIREIQEYFDTGMKLYQELLQKGIAKESARYILPMCSPTTLYVNGTIRDWLHYCDVRTKEDVQKEHRDIAVQIQALLREQLPNVAEAMWPERAVATVAQ